MNYLLAAPSQDKAVLLTSDFESDAWKTDWDVGGKNFTGRRQPPTAVVQIRSPPINSSGHGIGG
jgi:hypothetical protein